MHRALLLPEIIENVLLILRNETWPPTPLYNCLLVNKAFSLEACRIIWAVCGNWGNYGGPKILHLADILSKSPQRAQFYANLITDLSFSEEGEERDFMAEGRFHPQLKALQFPNLKEATFHGLDWESHTGEAMIHYIQPNLESFRVLHGSQISDRLLEALGQLCPRLRDFYMGNIHENTVSKEGLASFLRAADLHSLELDASFKGSLSHEAFKAVCEYRNLRLLSIPEIEEEWVFCLPKTESFHISDLGSLDTAISDQGLKCLAEYTPNLSDINLNLKELPSSHIIASAAYFHRLEGLKIEFGRRSSINGSDLLLLARNCPNLTELSLNFEFMEDCASASGVDDNVMEDITLKWPGMEELFLLAPLREVTWKSALSFGRNCKELKRLKLCCNFSWEEAMLNATSDIFPELWFLDIISTEGNLNAQVPTFDPVRFIEMAPKLTSFSFSGRNEADEAREEAIKTALIKREYPEYFPYSERDEQSGRGGRGGGLGNRGRGRGGGFL